MPTSPPKRGGWTAIILAAVLVFGGYGAAYLSLVRRTGVAHQEIAVSPDGMPQFITFPPAYPYRGLSTVFAPAHWLDRKIRPGYWSDVVILIP